MLNRADLEGKTMLRSKSGKLGNLGKKVVFFVMHELYFELDWIQFQFWVDEGRTNRRKRGGNGRISKRRGTLDFDKSLKRQKL